MVTAIFSTPTPSFNFSRARKEQGLKLPDAIIAGTAIAKGLTVLTADDHFKKPKAPWRARFFAVDAGI